MQEPSQGRLDTQFPFEPSTKVLQALRLLTTVLEARFASLEQQRATYDAAVDELIQVGLFRIDDVLRPALIALEQAANTGFPSDRITDAGNAGKAVLKANTHSSLVTALALTATDLPFAAKAESPDLGNAPLADTAPIATNSRRLATTGFVQALIANLVNSSPAALDTLNELAAALGNDPNFSTTVLNALADRYTKAVTDAALSDRYTKTQADTAFTRRRNRVINPGMQWSEEKGDAVTAVTGNVALYALDGFLGICSATGTLNMQRAKSRAPSGSPYRLRATVASAQPSPANGDFFAIEWRLEGFDVSDLGWGSALAKPAIMRFTSKLPAGTYGFAVRNGASSYSYTTSFVVAAADANKDKEWTFSIPAQTAGVWADDQNVGLVCDLVLMAGSDYTGTAGWQAGNKITVSGQSNFMATAGAVAELCDVGVYLGTIAPNFELPDSYESFRKVCRYFYTQLASVEQKSATTVAFAASKSNVYTQDTMRVTPTVQILEINNGVIVNSDGSTRAPVAGDINATSYSTRLLGFWFKAQGRGESYAEFRYSASARL